MPGERATLNPPGAVAKDEPAPISGGGGGRGLVMRRPQRILTGSELFVKKYRTEVAASASSCVSTFIAVSSSGFSWFPEIRVTIRAVGC